MADIEPRRLSVASSAGGDLVLQIISLDRELLQGSLSNRGRIQTILDDQFLAAAI
jgi:hypothetical protein